MIEIRIHGRGGQGAVTASELIAIAAYKDGKFSQAFPKFGPERTGAPVEAYCRIDDEFINLRAEVYNPNYLIILDDSLPDVTKGLEKNGTIIINSDKTKKIGIYKTITIDATKIAIETFGRNIVNTAVLGAFAKATKLLSLRSIEEAIKEKFPSSLAEKNILAVKKAYEVCKR